MCWLQTVRTVLGTLGERVSNEVIDVYYNFTRWSDCCSNPVEMCKENGDIKETRKSSSSEAMEPTQRPLETLQQWNNAFINKKPGGTSKTESTSTKANSKMTDRPLPVPVENESYFMNVDRNEAVKLLEGHNDGAFILRPSSQPDHIYSLSIVFNKKVYNIGLRRRKDGRVAIGYSKLYEESHASVKELINFHQSRKLIVVEAGKTVGATVLRKVV